jgi:hypothetical protein
LPDVGIFESDSTLVHAAEARLEPFVTMLAHLHEPLLLVSGSGVIVAGNVAAAEALGTTTRPLAGTTAT